MASFPFLAMFKFLPSISPILQASYEPITLHSTPSKFGVGHHQMYFLQIQHSCLLQPLTWPSSQPRLPYISLPFLLLGPSILTEGGLQGFTVWVQEFLVGMTVRFIRLWHQSNSRLGGVIIDELLFKVQSSMIGRVWWDWWLMTWRQQCDCRHW